MGAVCNRMGAILHHMGAKVVPTVRQICELSALYRAICTVRELLTPYWSRMEAPWATWEPCGSHVAPC
jgi:hypothetical protein